MVIKETYDLKSPWNRRFDTEYIYDAKTLKSMNIAKFLVLGLAVGGMLFTCTMAKGNLTNKLHIFALVKKKGSKEETHESQRDNKDSEMLSFTESPD